MKYRAITGCLVARTAVHIGAGEASFTTDALLRRNAAGAVFLPGTAIAGALRALMTRIAPRISAGQPCKALQNDDSPQCGCDVCCLFGDVNQSDEEHTPTGASRIWIFDANAATPIHGGTVRDSVGIDRASRTAARASASKFNLETLPAQTRFTLRIELQNTVTATGERLLAAALAEWQAGRVWLGGRVARGLGAFAVEDLQIVTHNLDTNQGIVDFLKLDHPWEIGEERVKNANQQAQEWIHTRVQAIKVVPAPDSTIPVARAWVSAEFRLAADGPFLTTDSIASAASGFDHAPLHHNADAWLHPVLPGASLRGVLRSHAERIARTLATHTAWQQPEDQRANSFNTLCPACDPLMSRRPNGQGVPLESCDSLLRNQQHKDGNVYIPEQAVCLACRLFGSPRRGSRLLIEDAQFDGGIPQFKMLDFLAIDRFTGGSADRLKFDALVLWKPVFRVRMHLENPQPWELGWLMLLLRDLYAGMLSVGYGAAKGFGKVHIEKDWRLTFGLLDSADLPVAPDADTSVHTATRELAIGAAKGQTCYSELQYTADDQQRWLILARDWVRSFNAHATSPQARPSDMPIPSDSYFGHTQLTSMYPPKIEEEV